MTLNKNPTPTIFNTLDEVKEHFEITYVIPPCDPSSFCILTKEGQDGKFDFVNKTSQQDFNKSHNKRANVSISGMMTYF